jgi:anti-sigma regulatory factor (Ser/Thr protein kinase)
VNQHSQQERGLHGRVRQSAAPLPVAVGHGADTRSFPSRPRDVPAAQEIFKLPAHGSSVSQARSLVRERLSGSGLRQELRDDAVLVISELFTNAVVHTGSVEVVCRLRVAEDSVYLAVVDQGLDLVGPHVRAPDTEGGRGLLLVSALAEEWGVDDEHGAGRVVWAILRTHDTAR